MQRNGPESTARKRAFRTCAMARFVRYGSTTRDLACARVMLAVTSFSRLLSMKTTLDEMSAFVTIADVGSLTRAAEKLHQPTSVMSRLLSRLEQKLDTT